MWTLINREFRSLRVPIFLMMTLTAMFVTIILVNVSEGYGFFSSQIGSSPPMGISGNILTTFHWIFVVYSISFCVLGTGQMIIDKKWKHSSFLCTLATSRRRIFLVRIISGLLCAVVTTFLLSAATAFAFWKWPRLVPLDVAYLVRMAVMLFCLSWTGYMLGLQSGWRSNAFARVFGGVGVLALVISIVLFKGISNESLLLILTISILALLRAWSKYSSSSL